MLRWATIVWLVRPVDGIVPPQSAVFPFLEHSTPRTQDTSASVCQRPHALYEEVADVLKNAVVLVSRLLDRLSSEIGFPTADGPLGEAPTFGEGEYQQATPC